MYEDNGGEWGQYFSFKRWTLYINLFMRISIGWQWQSYNYKSLAKEKKIVGALNSFGEFKKKKNMQWVSLH